MSEIEPPQSDDGTRLYILGPEELRQAIVTLVGETRTRISADAQFLPTDSDADRFVLIPIDFADPINRSIALAASQRFRGPQTLRALYAHNAAKLDLGHIVAGYDAYADRIFGAREEPELRTFLRHIPEVVPRKDRDHNEVLYARIEDAMGKGDRNELQRIVTRLTPQVRDTPRLLRPLITAHSIMRNYKKNVHYCRVLLEINPQDVWAAANYALAHVKLNTISKADEVLGSLFPYDPPAGRKNSPLETLRRFSPASRQLLQNMAQIALKRSKRERAFALFDLLTIPAATDPAVKSRWHYEAALLAGKLANREQVAFHLEACKQLNPPLAKQAEVTLGFAT